MAKQALEQLQKEIREIPGHVGFWYEDLTTGETAGYHADDVYGAASVIKLPLYMAICKWAAEGTASMEEVVTVRGQDKVPICGALTLFTGDVEVDVATLCRLMISISDNTATNVLIAQFGVDRISVELTRMGLSGTRLQRKLWDAEGEQRGLRNTIVPAEIGRLLAQVYRGEFVNQETSDQIRDTLLLQQIGHKLGGKIGYEYEIAHKTGEEEHRSHDVGIVYAPNPFVLCFAGEETDVYAWEDLMRRSAWALCQ